MSEKIIKFILKELQHIPYQFFVFPGDIDEHIFNSLLEDGWIVKYEKHIPSNGWLITVVPSNFRTKNKDLRRC